MTMTLPRPSACGTRPAYLDNLFKDRSPSLGTSSMHSTSSSGSNLDLRTPHQQHHHQQHSLPRAPLPPAYEQTFEGEEEQDQDPEDQASLRSLRLSPRFNVHKLFHRRTYPQAREISPTRTTSRTKAEPPPSTSPPIATIQTPASSSRSSSRRPSLPKLQTAFPPAPRKGSLPARPTISGSGKDKPLPAAPVQPAKEVTCQRCYYFAARNCNGWVMGGTHGDACEGCLQAGFFGAP
ncbi:hypothetical protein B0A50_02316 [Salinomyces thailandicus]|uniref:Uncharacterized protein n=1 Tax=Salinomyces thailandicus TaxID=706561 RepID=A0A4V6WJW4_9PEZI|nr:hypothetical protein B0A50_02316 [Salinomyces thailandica]